MLMHFLTAEPTGKLHLNLRRLRRMDVPLFLEQARGFDSLDLGLVTMANCIGEGHDVPRVMRF